MKNRSVFPGMQFNPEDNSIPVGPKTDPMTQGVDRVKLNEMENTLNDLIALRKLPKNYTIHNEMQLLQRNRR